MGILASIAENTGIRETVISTNPGEFTQLCQADVKRYSVGFCSPGGLGPIITTNSGGTVGMGLPLQPGRIYWFRVKDDGPFAQVAWFDSTNVGAINIIVYEVFLPRG